MTSTLMEEGGDVGQAMSVDERVSVSMQSFPLAVGPSEDLGHAKIPSTFDALLVVSELDCSSLDEDEPGEIALGSAVEEFDRAGAASPLGGDHPLALRRFGAAWTEAAYSTEDRAVVGQGVWGTIAVDPRPVVGTAALEKLGELIINRHRSTSLPRHRTSTVGHAAVPAVGGARAFGPVA